MKMKEVYVTQVEQEAYDLCGQLALAQVRCAVLVRQDRVGRPFYVGGGEGIRGPGEGQSHTPQDVWLLV